MNKMKVKKVIFYILILGNFITGCDNSKAANEDNFKKAIANILPKQKINCFTMDIKLLRYFKEPVSIDFPLDLEKKEEEGFTQLKVLAKVGVLSTSETTTREALSIPQKLVPATRYTLTKEGEKFFKRDLTIPGTSKKKNAFCFGETEIDKVINFTEPESFFGTTASRVKYTYRIKNLPSWTSDSEVQALIPKVAKMVRTKDKPAESTITLFLTSKGWAGKL